MSECTQHSDDDAPRHPSPQKEEEEAASTADALRIIEIQMHNCAAAAGALIVII